ncbi:unnamed protein product [Amoebophrya sp. A25]|nr:unnamed protein product [Amoebophrya sp. A25]|eukprot:GSA25T00002878001.1
MIIIMKFLLQRLAFAVLPVEHAPVVDARRAGHTFSYAWKKKQQGGNLTSSPASIANRTSSLHESLLAADESSSNATRFTAPRTSGAANGSAAIRLAPSRGSSTGTNGRHGSSSRVRRKDNYCDCCSEHDKRCLKVAGRVALGVLCAASWHYSLHHLVVGVERDAAAAGAGGSTSGDRGGNETRSDYHRAHPLAQSAWYQFAHEQQLVNGEHVRLAESSKQLGPYPISAPLMREAQVRSGDAGMGEGSGVSASSTRSRVWRIPTVHHKKHLHDLRGHFQEQDAGIVRDIIRNIRGQDAHADDDGDVSVAVQNIGDILIVAEAHVGESEPLRFILDTGSSDNWVVNLNASRMHDSRSLRDGFHPRTERSLAYTCHAEQGDTNHGEQPRNGEDKYGFVSLRYGTGAVRGQNCRESISLKTGGPPTLKDINNGGEAAGNENVLDLGSGEMILADDLDAFMYDACGNFRLSGILGLGLPGIRQVKDGDVEGLVEKFARLVVERKEGDNGRGEDLHGARTTSSVREESTNYVVVRAISSDSGREMINKDSYSFLAKRSSNNKEVEDVESTSEEGQADQSQHSAVCHGPLCCTEHLRGQQKHSGTDQKLELPVFSRCSLSDQETPAMRFEVPGFYSLPPGGYGNPHYDPRLRGMGSLVLGPFNAVYPGSTSTQQEDVNVLAVLPLPNKPAQHRNKTSRHHSSTPEQKLHDLSTSLLELQQSSWSDERTTTSSSASDVVSSPATATAPSSSVTPFATASSAAPPAAAAASSATPSTVSRTASNTSTPISPKNFAYWLVQIEEVYWSQMEGWHHAAPILKSNTTRELSNKEKEQEDERKGKTAHQRHRGVVRNTFGLFDSGTTTLVLPQEVYMTFQDACYPPIQGEHPVGWPTACCYEGRVEDRPILNLRLGGELYRLYSTDYCGSENNALIESSGAMGVAILGEVVHRKFPVTYLLESPYGIVLPKGVSAEEEGVAEGVVA